MQNEELRLAHAEAETARQRYAELYDSAPVGYFTLSRDSTIREVNLTGARLLGLERTGLVDRRLALFVAEGDRAALDAAITKALESKVVESCDVTLAPVAQGASPSPYVQMTFAARGGGVVQVAAVDSTERKRSDDMVRTSQKLEAIGQLAGGVAHDFNNLLTVIMHHSDVALEAVAVGAPLHEDLVELKAAAERAAALTRQLLAFSRQHVVKPEEVDLNALVRNIAAMLRRMIGEDIQLVLSLTATPASIQLDPTQLDQLLMNLAVNARDAMAGGGTLTVSTTNLDVPAGRHDGGSKGTPGPCVRLTVTDTGTGMGASTMDHAFEPFFTTKEVGRGTGLGLSTVFGIVKQCGGNISLRSELGHGTTFDIDFPRSLAHATTGASVERKQERALGGTETILVVDDEPALLRIATRVLGSAGYTVLGAASGAEALLLCERHAGAIHLAVSDVIMPGMSGVAFAERLRRARPETKILYMSGYTADALGPDHGITDSTQLLSKPFTSDELRRRVREVLSAVSSEARR
jgi:PAS domain S-box-containing protein